LGVFDGLPGLDAAFKEVYPKADVQHCVVHKVRATFPKIRVKHKTDVIEALKTVYTAADEELARAAFDTVKAKWSKLYPKEMDSWEEQLSTLLTFYKYPADIRKAIYTSNPIERMNKEIRKRLKPMNSLTNMDAAEKIVYLEAIDYNERFADRMVPGFGAPTVKEQLSKLFEERYSTVETLAAD
ncbi:IS256 family transposase, partial [Paenibacillus sp. BAC0078]